MRPAKSHHGAPSKTWWYTLFAQAKTFTHSLLRHSDMGPKHVGQRGASQQRKTAPRGSRPPPHADTASTRPCQQNCGLNTPPVSMRLRSLHASLSSSMAVTRGQVGARDKCGNASLNDPLPDPTLRRPDCRLRRRRRRSARTRSAPPCPCPGPAARPRPPSPPRSPRQSSSPTHPAAAAAPARGLLRRGGRVSLHLCWRMCWHMMPLHSKPCTETAADVPLPQQTSQNNIK